VLEPIDIIRIKSREKFELIEQLTEYIKSNISSEFVNDLFRPEYMNQDKFYKKYLIYKSKYMKLKAKLLK
jgi:transcriptional regulator CtsR